MLRWYILGKGRKRKAPSRKSTEASKRNPSSAPNDDDKGKDSGITGPSKQASRRKKRGHDEDSDEQTAESSDEESVNEDEEEESFDLEPYDYLLGQAHYDPEDNGVFKSVKIVAEDFGNGAEVVVYRSCYNSNLGKWGKVNLNDPIKVGDVIKYQKSKANVAKLNAVLRPITAKPKKK